MDKRNETKEFRVYNTFQDYTNNNYTVINDSLSSVSDNKSILDSTLKKVWVLVMKSHYIGYLMTEY